MAEPGLLSYSNLSRHAKFIPISLFALRTVSVSRYLRVVSAG
jgi:hypothetical protein